MTGFKKIQSHSNLTGVDNADIGVIEGHINDEYPLQFPVLTTVERDAIGLPIEGMKIFNSTTGLYNKYEDSAWGEDLSDGSVNPSKLDVPFKDISALAGIEVDWDLELTRTKTITGETTLTFTNLYEGVKFLKITGDFNMIFPVGFVYVGGERSTSVNWYQVVCEDADTPTGIYTILKDES